MTLMLCMIMFYFFLMLRIITMSTIDTITMVYITAAATRTSMMPFSITLPSNWGTTIPVIFVLVWPNKVVVFTITRVLAVFLIVIRVLVLFMTYLRMILMPALVGPNSFTSYMVVFMSVNMLTRFLTKTEFSFQRSHII